MLTYFLFVQRCLLYFCFIFLHLFFANHLSLLLSAVQKEKGYGSLQDEAVKIFNSLQEMEIVSNPVAIIQGILQTCHDLRPLRDEVYCQLIKQTNHVPQPNSPAKPCTLAPAHLHELHLLAQSRHSALPPIPLEKVTARCSLNSLWSWIMAIFPFHGSFDKYCNFGVFLWIISQS